MKLYDTLEVATEAAPEEIKNSYRKLSMIHHPDKGGDPETFSALAIAYEILSDPKKRKRYDVTGEFEKQPDVEVQAQQLIATLFIQVMTEKGEKILQTKVFNVIEDLLERNIEAAKGKTKDIRKEIRLLKKLLKKVTKKSKDTPNVVSGMLEQGVLQKGQEIEQTKKGVEPYKVALKLIKDYDFNADEAPIYSTFDIGRPQQSTESLFFGGGFGR